MRARFHSFSPFSLMNRLGLRATRDLPSLPHKIKSTGYHWIRLSLSLGAFWGLIIILLLCKDTWAGYLFPTPKALRFADNTPKVETANPSAHPDAKKILNYLVNLQKRSSNRLVAGQYLSSYPGVINQKYQDLVTDLQAATGKWVAMISAGFREDKDLTVARDILISYWKSGGLVTVHWPANNPWTGGDCHSAIPEGHTIGELIDPESDVYRTWIAKLDKVASVLSDMQDEGVMVLWRPFHEMNGGWFWWGNNDNWPSQSDFTAVWRHMFNYLTKTKGLNNLLWVYAAKSFTGESYYGGDNRKHATYFYPGNSYVDIVGIDEYTNVINEIKQDTPRGMPYGLPTVYEDMVALGKPFALTEFGPTGQVAVDGTYDYRYLIREIREYFPKVCYVLAWSGPSLHPNKPDRKWAYIYHQHHKEFFYDPWVVTRDELDWR